jgi:integrase
MFVAALGNRRVEQCQAGDLVEFIECEAAWASRWTKRHNCILIKSAFNAAVRHGLIPVNPFRSANFAPGPPGREMTEAEFEALLRVARRALRRVLIFCRQTGAMPGEARHLTRSDVDLDRRLATLHGPNPTGGRRPRLILLNDAAAEQLAVLLRTMPPGQEHVFVNSAGRRWSQQILSKAVCGARRRAGIPPEVKLYTMKHLGPPPRGASRSGAPLPTGPASYTVPPASPVGVAFFRVDFTVGNGREKGASAHAEG